MMDTFRPRLGHRGRYLEKYHENECSVHRSIWTRHRFIGVVVFRERTDFAEISHQQHGAGSARKVPACGSV